MCQDRHRDGDRKMATKWSRPIDGLSQQLWNDVGVKDDRLCRSIETRRFWHGLTLQNLKFDPTQRRESVAKRRRDITLQVGLFFAMRFSHELTVSLYEALLERRRFL